VLLFSLAFLNLYSQDYHIVFAGTGESVAVVDEVMVENLARGTSITLKGSEILHLKKSLTNLPAVSLDGDLLLYPNPTVETCTAEFSARIGGKTHIAVYDMSGKLVANTTFLIREGTNRFTIDGLKKGLYAVRISAPENSSMGKIISLGSPGYRINISHTGHQVMIKEKIVLKSGTAESVMEYSDGELLKFTGSSGIFKTVVMDIPGQSKMIAFPFRACTDADGNHYPIVRIGPNIWMAEDLKTTKYQNNDPITLITGNNSWGSTVSGAYCHYENSQENVKDFGQLYNWYAITDIRGICPTGWRVPDYKEITALSGWLGGEKTAGGKLKETGNSHWSMPNLGASNATGFTAKPGGIRFIDGSFSGRGSLGNWWSPSSVDTFLINAFGLRHNTDSLKFFAGLKNNGMCVRCILDEKDTTQMLNIVTGRQHEAFSASIPASGGTMVVPTQGSPVDGLKITIPGNAFVSDQIFKVSYSEIKQHQFGKFFNPVSPLIGIAYAGGYADELMTVEVPVQIPAGHFAMGFLYNKATGELEGMPLVSITANSVTVATRHFAGSSIQDKQKRSRMKKITMSQAVTDSGYFVISSIALKTLKEQTDIVSDFEPGYDDWEFTNKGSYVSPDGICSGMCLSAMWYYTEERMNGNSQLFHKYDKSTIANVNQLWQDNTPGIKVASMVHYDYAHHAKAYEDAVDLLAKDKTKDSLSWYAFAYSILQTKEPQFIGIMSSTGGGHVLIANDVWMQDGKLWISDPNHPGNRTRQITYADQEFEPYYASLDANTNPKNFEYIAYYGKTAVVNWNLVAQRWEELGEGTIGSGVFPEVKLWVEDASGKTLGWELTEEFKTEQDTIILSIQDNSLGDYAFSLFDEEGYPLLSKNQQTEQLRYSGKLGLKPGLNIIGYTVYHRTYNGDNKEVWDWVDFKWIDIDRSISQKVLNETKKSWHTTIKEAVDGSSNGDILTVYPGIYKENVTIVQKNITLRSAKGPEVTLIEGSGNGTGLYVVNSNIAFEGFTVRNFYNGFYLMEYNTGNVTVKPVIQNNRVEGCRSAGIIVYGKIAPIIRGNILDDNTYYGIDFDKYAMKKTAEPALVENNIISGHNRGVRVDGETVVNFSRNTILNNEYGVEVLGKSIVSFDGDTLQNNTSDGIRIFLAQEPVTISNCMIRNNSYAGVISTTDSGIHTLRNNTIEKNGTGIYFQHYSTGQCEVQILNNVVSGNKKGMEVRVSKCTISGNSVSDNTEEGGINLVSTSGEVSGNSVTGNVSWIGGGIYIHSTGELMIKKNTVSGNKATLGGGLGCQSNCIAVIRENIFSQNQASENGGGLYINTAGQKNPVVESNVITGNYAKQKGGGIYGFASGWKSSEVVTVSGKDKTVTRYVPCFTENSNSYNGNSHGEKFGEWGPGVDKWCTDAGYDVHP
jgi:uncharacterized protein (TIGR02145 family)